MSGQGLAGVGARAELPGTFASHMGEPRAALAEREGWRRWSARRGLLEGRSVG